MPEVKIRPADFPMSSIRYRLDLPVILSIAAIVSVAAVVGVAAFHSGIFTEKTRLVANLFFPQNEINPTKTSSPAQNVELEKKIERLNWQLAKVTTQLNTIKSAQSSDAKRIDKIEDAFSSITASIPTPTPNGSSPYHRLLETRWDADDMVTRTQKRDRHARLHSKAILQNMSISVRSPAPEKTRFAIELASYENIITARTAWQKLNETHGSLLNKLEPHLLPELDRANKKGRVKLIVGPIKTATKAAQLCSILRSNGQICQERLFSSSKLMVVSAPKNTSVALSK